MANNKQPWFKEQSHIWQPVSWQGWLTLVTFSILVVGNALIVWANPYSNELLWLYLNVLFLAIVSLLIIGHNKGPAA